ncbi:MAG: HD domain-containing protein [Verrucomicrobiaceae bacterium]|nr:MAG: HD domain-containing protein [Verrucomicrobiaceae bacterium]
MHLNQRCPPGSLSRAIEIAVEAHADVLDKAGAPYILHPLRVMFSLDTEVERIVGVLHDVVEDGGPHWSFDRLASEGFSQEVIDALRSVSKLPEEQDVEGDSISTKRERYLKFVRRAGAHPLGRKVKLADLQDNLSAARLRQLTPRDSARMNRYLEAKDLLTNQLP